MAHPDDERDGEAERPRPHSAAQSQPDISQVHTSVLRLPNDAISHLHATPLIGPGEPRPVGPAEAARSHTVPPPAPPGPSSQSARFPGSSASLPAIPPTSAAPHAGGTQFLTQTNVPPLALPNTPSYLGHSDALADTTAQIQARAEREVNLAEAQRWRMQADELGAVIKRDTDYFAMLTARWRELVHMAHRSAQDDFSLAQLEVEVPRYSQRLARARKRWTECLEHAREHEDRAQRLQAGGR